MRSLPLLILFAAAPAFAGSPQQDPLQDALSTLQESLRQLVPSIAGRAPVIARAGALPFESSVTPDLRRQLDADFDVLRGLRGSDASPFHRVLFGPLAGPSYARYFDARVHRIGARSCGAPAAVACVAPLVSTDTMWIAPTYSTFDLPLVYRLAVVLHEARHTERAHGFYGHSDCPRLDLQGNPIIGIFSRMDLGGKPACDEQALGAYGVGLVFMKNMQRHCSNCTGKMLMDAELYGDDTLKRITDRPSYDQLRADLYP